MLFDTHPGGTPLPILSHRLADCSCGHLDELHEEVEAAVGGESKPLVICLECDGDEDEI